MLKNTPILVLLLCILFSAKAMACNKPVDPKKVMLFIDTNLSLKEVEVAKKGACDRGERFVLHPDDEFIDKTRRVFYNYLTKDEYYNNKCKSEDSPACDRLGDEVDRLKKQMDDFDFDAYEMNAENIKKALASVKESKASISTLIVSGHDGGGEVSGDYISGSFTKNEFFTAYDEVFDADDKKHLESVLLWGCYTGTYSEASDWKSQFPEARAIVGFYDSAPLATRPASSDLMLDFLQKEHQLYEIEDEKELKRSIQSLKSILYVQPGLMINACHNEDIYYAHYQDGDRRKTFFLTPKDADAQCQLVIDEWDEKKGTYQLHLDGDKEIPDSLRGSEIRAIYGLVRQNEKCFKDRLNIDANKIGLLLFWNGVRENFSQKYGDLMDEAQKELEALIQEGVKAEEDYKEAQTAYRDQQSVIRDLSSYYYGDAEVAKMEKEIEERKDKDEVYKELHALFADSKDPEVPDALKQKISESYEYNWFYRDMKKLKEQKEIAPAYKKYYELDKKYNDAHQKYYDYISFTDLKGSSFPIKGMEKYPRKTMVETLRRVNNIFPKESFQKIKDKYPNLEKAYKKMDNLLYQLDPSCMNFLEWHQYNPNKPLPKNQCEEN